MAGLTPLGRTHELASDSISKNPSENISIYERKSEKLQTGTGKEETHTRRLDEKRDPKCSSPMSHNRDIKEKERVIKCKRENQRTRVAVTPVRDPCVGRRGDPRNLHSCSVRRRKKKKKVMKKALSGGGRQECVKRLN